MSSGEGQVIHHRVEHGLNALILERRAANHREDLHPDAALRYQREALRCDRLTFDELFQTVCRRIRHSLNQCSRYSFAFCTRSSGISMTSYWPESRRARLRPSSPPDPRCLEIYLPRRWATGWVPDGTSAGPRWFLSNDIKPPTRSILLMKQIRNGYIYLPAAILSIAATPATASNTVTVFIEHAELYPPRLNPRGRASMMLI